MELPLASPVRRWSFLVAALVLAAALVYPAGKRWLSEYLAGSSDPDDWVRAAALEPGNAEHWHRLGRYRQFDFERADIQQAIGYYQRATQLDPGSARYWMDLAGAYEAVSKPAQAQAAFERAKSAHGVSAEVAWHYGNFLLRQGKLSEAFAEIRRAVVADRNLIYPGVSVCWRASGDVTRVLNEVLPAGSEAYASALNFLLAQQESDAALAVWRRWIALNQPFDLRAAFPLLELLLRNARWSDARTVWQESLEAAGKPPRATPAGSLVWDGSFDVGFLNGGFAWRQQTVTGASIGFDTGAGDAHARALRVDFDGTANISFEHVSQVVLVEPGTRYRFRAKIRTREITTDTGVQFRVTERQNPEGQYWLTPGLLGTNPWTLQELEFTTGKSTHLVEIILRRAPSRKFDNKINGTVWVDDVALEPVSAARGGAR
jgi:tetratricopeptide (TPR) repeat protein